MLATPSHGTMANSSLPWTETTMYILVTVPTIRKVDGGIMPALTPTSMESGIGEDITVAAIKMAFTGPSSAAVHTH